VSASRSSLPQQQVYAAAGANRSTQTAHQVAPKPKQRPVVKTVRSAQVKKGLPTMIYWFALAAMCFCIFQCVRTIAMESYSLLARINSQPIIERYYQQTVQENKVLQERIQNASTRQGIEAMARNYLNLTGEGEILVRLH
jgi:hypothetical protein